MKAKLTFKIRSVEEPQAEQAPPPSLSSSSSPPCMHSSDVLARMTSTGSGRSSVEGHLVGTPDSSFLLRLLPPPRRRRLPRTFPQGCNRSGLGRWVADGCAGGPPPLHGGPGEPVPPPPASRDLRGARHVTLEGRGGVG
eukprot:563527-Rhodomonas_salina.1